MTRLSVVAFAIAATLALASVGATGAKSSAACRTSGLVVWLDTRGDHTAGSTYYKLEFTNLSTHACVLSGYPGVSAIDLAGRRLGRAAARNQSSAPRPITLRGKATATAALQITDVHNFSSSVCRPQTAAGLRVYPPNQTRWKVVPFPFLACTRSVATYLRIAAVGHR